MNDRRRPGEIRDAILMHLSLLGGPATVEELHRAVQEQLAESVAPSSVRSYLRLNTPELFVRVGRGQYRLQDYSEQLALTQTPVPLVYEHGHALLYQGDCMEWLRSAAATSIHAVVTDPPYGLVEYTASEQRKLRSGRGGVWRIPPAFDGHKRAPLPRFTTLRDEDIAQLDAFFTRWARAVLRVLVPGGHVVVASNPLLSHIVASAVVRAGFERRGEIIRLVMTMRGGDRPKNAHKEFADVSVMPRSMWEPWLLFRKPLDGRVMDNLRRWKTGGLRRFSEERPFGDVIQSHPTRAEERALAPHPSLKPQAFLRQIVRAVLPLGEGIVLDPFAGSGSTLAAAEAVGYDSIGIERDERYAEMAKCAIPKLSALHHRC